jgi:hypothetical protein
MSCVLLLLMISYACNNPPGNSALAPEPPYR